MSDKQVKPELMPLYRGRVELLLWILLRDGYVRFNELSSVVDEVLELGVQERVIFHPQETAEKVRDLATGICVGGTYGDNVRDAWQKGQWCEIQRGGSDVG
jgi:hypothetical protein